MTQQVESSPCPFCSPDPGNIFHEDDLVLALWDGFPVSPGHALLVPRRHIADWTEATPEEQAALTRAIGIAQRAIEQTHQPGGYNVGFNNGTAAGQTVPHLHIHVIPRYVGDVADPRGGIRHVIPDKARYWTD